MAKNSGLPFLEDAAELPRICVDTEFLEEARLTISSALQAADAGAVEELKEERTADKAIFLVSAHSVGVTDLIAKAITDDVDVRRLGVTLADLEYSLLGPCRIFVTVRRPQNDLIP